MPIRHWLTLVLLFLVSSAWSAVSSEISRTDFVGTGLLAAYSTSFPVKATSEVRVFTQDASGEDVELSLGVNYSAALSTTGLCTVTLTAGNLTNGYKLSLQRGIPLTQTYNAATSGLNAASLNTALDQIVMRLQRVESETKRSIKIPYLEAGGDTVTKLDAPAATRANQAVVFDASGNAMVGGTVGVSASAFAQTLLDDTTATEARTTLGFPTALDDMTVLADGSTARRDLGVRFSEIVNAKDFGAVGDGVTDDTAAIQAALDSVSQSVISAGVGSQAYRYGGVVRLTKGAFRITSSLYVNSFIHLIGDGKYSFSGSISAATATGTVIICDIADTSQAAVRMNGFVAATGIRYAGVTSGSFPIGADIDAGTYTQVNDASVENLTIYTAGSHEFGLLMIGAPRSFVKNVAVRGFDTGIWHQAGWATSISNVTVEQSTEFGIYLGANTNAMDLRGAYVDNASNSGETIHMYGCYGTTIDTCVVEHGDTNGIAMDSCFGVYIRNLWVEGTEFTGAALAITDSYNITWDGGWVFASNLAGLVTNTTGCTAEVRRVSHNATKTINSTNAFTNVTFHGMTPGASDTPATVSGQVLWLATPKDTRISGTTWQQALEIPAAGYHQTNVRVNSALAYSVRHDSATMKLLDSGGNVRLQLDPNNFQILFPGGATALRSQGSTPEGAITAGVGSLFMRNDGGSASAAYVKESGAGNTGWRALAGHIQGSATYDPASLADGSGATTTVTVTGAALGDYAEASFSIDLQGITVTAYVSSANTVSVRFQNESGGVLDLASGTLRARVRGQ